MRPRVFDLYLEASMEPGRKDREHRSRNLLLLTCRNRLFREQCGTAIAQSTLPSRLKFSKSALTSARALPRVCVADSPLASRVTRSLVQTSADYAVGLIGSRLPRFPPHPGR